VKRIVIDPGHGGWDPGAIALDGVPEREFTWQLSGTLGDYLCDRYEVEVVYTHRGADTALDPTGNQARELAARSGVANAINADLLISIHHDNTGNPSVRGASLWVWTNKNSPTGGLVWLPATGNHTDPKTYPIAKAMVGRIRETLAALGIPWRDFGDPDGLACSNFGILRNTRGPAVLIECFHGSNREDVAIARRPEFIPALARATGDAVAAALGLPARAMPGPFSDVPADHWAAEAIARAKDMQIIAGHPDGTFGLGQPLKREEAVTMATRLYDVIMAAVEQRMQGGNQ